MTLANYHPKITPYFTTPDIGTLYSLGFDPRIPTG